MKYKTLNNGVEKPMIGLGVYNIPKRETQRVVEDAVCLGCQSIDTAAIYDNERGVGDALIRFPGCLLTPVHQLSA